MYNIIVVDDERIVREGLCTFFADGKLGFNVTGSFGDGEKAFEYLKEYADDVDVVLTDIAMPRVSGLDLLGMINEAKMDIETVLLTGYKDFEYAQTAVKYGVYRYLLKPIKFHELDEVFMELKQKLDGKSNMVSSEENDERMQLLINQFLIEVYSGIFENDAAAWRRLSQLKIDRKFMDKPCVIAEILRNIEEMHGENKYDYERFDNAVINSIRDKDIEYYPLKSDKGCLKIAAMPKNRNEDFFINVEKCILTGIDELKQIFLAELKVVNTDCYESILQLRERAVCENEPIAAHTNDEINNSVIERALRYVAENYSKNIYISDVAEYVSLNPVYFGRLFKIYTGENFTDYLINIRLEKATELLECGNMKISEVSESVGYNNVKYFSRLFKRRTGKTPNDYKKERM